MFCPPGDKKKPGICRVFQHAHEVRAALLNFGCLLHCADVGSLVAFLPGGDIKRNMLTFGQGFESRALDCGKMGEEIIASVFRGDEAEALGIIEPLYSTCCHILSLQKIKRGNIVPKGRRSRQQNNEWKNTGNGG